MEQQERGAGGAGDSDRSNGHAGEMQILHPHDDEPDRNFAEHVHVEHPARVLDVFLRLDRSEIVGHGGLCEIKKINTLKAKMVYDVIDQSNGFYSVRVLAKKRSIMNIPFGIHNEEIQNKFLMEAKKTGLLGLEGHRLISFTMFFHSSIFPILIASVATLYVF